MKSEKKVVFRPDDEPIQVLKGMYQAMRVVLNMVEGCVHILQDETNDETDDWAVERLEAASKSGFTIIEALQEYIEGKESNNKHNDAEQ